MSKFYFLLLSILLTETIIAQSVGIGTATPDPSARLDITSTTQGFLLPSLTSAQRSVITHPAAGLLVFQTDGDPGFYYYNGTTWSGFTNGYAVSAGGTAVASPNYGLTYTLAGNGTSAYAGGSALTSSFNTPLGLAVDAAGIVYISDTYNNRIRKLTLDGTVTTLAGSGAAGAADGLGTAASFNQPAGIAVDNTGNLYVADQLNNKIRKITPAGMVSTIAGSGSRGNVNGSPDVSSFYFPAGIAVDAAGNVYVADTYNEEIRRLGTDGLVSIFAGNPTFGSADGTGTDASFNAPSGITVGADGNLYVTDLGNNEVRKITPGGVVTTFAGHLTAGSGDGNRVTASFFAPAGITADAGGNLYLTDQLNERIRKISPAGIVSTLSGSGSAAFADGPPAIAAFNGPYGIAVDAAGNVYVADSYNHRIRKIITH